MPSFCTARSEPDKVPDFADWHGVTRWFYFAEGPLIDVAAMIGHDAVGDGQAQPRPLPVGPAGEKRLEEVLQHVLGHAAAVVADRDFRLAVACDRDLAVVIRDEAMPQRSL